jgi:hypothetical protein
VKQGGFEPLVPLELDEMPLDLVRPQRAENVELPASGRFRPPIGEVDDHTLFDAVHGDVRLIDEALQTFREPVIAPSLSVIAVYALPDDNPLAFIGDDEAVEIEIEPVLHRCAVDLGDQPTRRGERCSVDTDPIAD